MPEVPLTPSSDNQHTFRHCQMFPCGAQSPARLRVNAFRWGFTSPSKTAQWLIVLFFLSFSFFSTQAWMNIWNALLEPCPEGAEYQISTPGWSGFGDLGEVKAPWFCMCVLCPGCLGWLYIAQSVCSLSPENLSLDLWLLKPLDSGRIHRRPSQDRQREGCLDC